MSPEPIFDYLRQASSTDHGPALLWVAFLSVFAFSLLGITATSIWTLRKGWSLACLSWRGFARILQACRQRPGEVCSALLEALDDPTAVYNADECELLCGGASFMLNRNQSLMAVILGADEELDLISDLTPYEVSLLNARVKSLVLHLRMNSEKVKRTRAMHAMRTRREGRRA